MKLFNQARCVCFQNLRKWRTNYRIWVIAIILILLIHYYTKEIVEFSRQIDVEVSPWLFPFLFSQKYVKLLFLFPLLLLFCDAPFIDENQPYVIARSGRTSWSIGQISYIVIGSALYFLFLMILTIIINLFYIQFTFEWGKVLGTLANTNAGQIADIKMVISRTITHYFTPIQAMWFAFLLSWLAGVFLGLLIYVVNSLSNTRIFGVLATSFFLVFDATITDYYELYRFSPVSWSSIDRIDIEGLTQMPSITYIYIAFAVLIIGLILSAILINRKQSINVLPPI